MAKYTHDPLDILEGWEVMPVVEWLEDVACTLLMDCDGFGHPVKDGLEDSTIEIWPSRAGSDIPEDATHIAWYNK